MQEPMRYGSFKAYGHPMRESTRAGRGSGHGAESGPFGQLAESKLDNGVRIVVAPWSAEGPGVVAIQLWVRAGTSAEGPKEHGCAHLLEHMLFKPTAAGHEIATDVESLGGDVNAFTSHDETVFYATVPADALDDGFAALVEPVVRPLFDPDEVAREVEVVVEEIHQYDDDPPQRLGQALVGRLFGRHSYGRPVLGLAKEVRRHDAKVLRNFHRRAYAGRNITVVVSGPVDPARVRKLAQKRLGKLPRGRAAASEAAPKPPARTRVVVDRDVVHEGHAAIFWQAPTMADPDACAVDMAAAILGQGEASRLMVETRRRDGLVSDAYASYALSRLGGTFMLIARTPPDGVKEATQGLLAQVDRLSRVPVDEEELSRARIQLESDLIYRRETVSGLAHAIGYVDSLAGDLQAEARYHRRLREVGADDVRRACARWLTGSRAAVGVVVPRTQSDPAGLARTLGTLARTGTGSAARRGKLKRDREVLLTDLPGGLRLRVVPDERVPMAAGWLVWPGGQRLESPKQAGSAVLTARLLVRGTAERDGDALAREVDGLAASLDGLSGRNSLGLHFECLSQHIPTLVRRCFECATSPSFAPDEFEEERRVLLSEVAAEQDDPAELALRAMTKLIYGKHPYARSRRGDAASLQTLTPKGLGRAFASRYPLGRAVLSVCGAVDVDGLVGLVESLAEGGGAAPKGFKWPGKPPRVRARRAQEIIRLDKEQAHLCLGYPGFAMADPRAHVMEVLMTVLGGQSGRLFRALREEEGLVYHTSASSTEGVDGGHVTLYAATAQDKLERAREAMEREVARLLEARVARDELRRAKAWLIGQHEASRQRRSRVASLIAFDEIYGLGHRHHRGYAKRVRSVTAAQIQDLANEILAPTRQVAGIVCQGAPRRGRRKTGR